MSTPRNTLISGLLVAMLAVATAGCPSPTVEKPSDTDASLPRVSVTLRVAVVSDGPLARAIERLRGEWNELTDGQVETIELAADADPIEAASDTDLIVFPSRMIGALCEGGALRPVRQSVLKSDTLRFEDFLPLVRDHEVVYGQRVMALPVGCPAPLLLAPEGGAAAGVAIPENDTELALAYLAWAAPYAEHRSRVATLFDAARLEPRIADPPFVRALESFVSSAGEGPTRVVWPQRSAEEDAEGLVPQQIPGSDEMYDPIADDWEPASAGEQRATLLASSGRLIGVTASSRNAATAFRFAAWLVGPENSRLVSSASDNVAVCRGSLSRAADRWLADSTGEQGKHFAEATAGALRERRFLLAPRLPGSEEYLSALASNLREALDGKPADEALAETLGAWDAITDRIGRDAQRAAYQRSLNSAPLE